MQTTENKLYICMFYNDNQNNDVIYRILHWMTINWNMELIIISNILAKSPTNLAFKNALFVKLSVAVSRTLVWPSSMLCADYLRVMLGLHHMDSEHWQWFEGLPTLHASQDSSRLFRFLRTKEIQRIIWSFQIISNII